MSDSFAPRLSIIDRVIDNLDGCLRTLTHGTQPLTRPSPAESVDHTELSSEEKSTSAGLMRVNHTGEVCAQALYQGQALTAKLEGTRASMEQAAQEEVDHLAWCENRLQELNSRPSVLNPLWYSLSFGIGAGTGLIGDKLSLGFVAATEEQVCQHLKEHLQRLPEKDQRSRAIVNTMIEDEQRHGEHALDAGGMHFPSGVKKAMRLTSRLMTELSYRL